MMAKLKEGLRRKQGSLWIKLTSKITLGLLAFLLLISFLINLPVVQTILIRFVISDIEKKTGTTLSIGRIAVILPNKINVSEIYASDSRGDTLLNAKKIKVNINIFKLLRNKTQLNNLVINGATVNLKRFATDSSFNFQPYINAFSVNETHKSQTKEDTANNNYSLRIKKIYLADIKFAFCDSANHNYFRAMLGKANIIVRDLNLKDNRIDLSTFELANVMLSIVINSMSEKKTEPVDFDIGLQRILKLENVNLKYTNNVTHQSIDATNINLKLIPQEINLPDHRISVDKFQLTGAGLIIHKGFVPLSDSSKVKKSPEIDLLKSFPWDITVNNLYFKNNSYSYTDDNKLLQLSGIDYDHLQLKNINGNLKNIHLLNSGLNADINELSLSEKSGFILNRFSTSVRYTGTQAEIKNLTLQTPFSVIQNFSVIGHAAADQLLNHPGEIKISTKITKSKIGLEDLLIFFPQLSKMNRLFSNPERFFSIDGSIEGKIHKLTIEHLVAGFDSTIIQISGIIQGLPDISSTSYDMIIDTLGTTRNNMLTILGDSLIPGSINLPQKIDLTGRFNRSAGNLKALAKVKTTFGDIMLEVRIKDDTVPDFKYYSATMDLRHFDAGKMLSDTIMGTVTLKAHTEGSYPTDSILNANVRFDVRASEIAFAHYKYTNADILGKYKDHLLTASMNYSDSNLVFRVGGTVDFSDTIPAFKINLNISGADLQSLKLTGNKISLLGKVTADFKGKNLNSINGKIDLSNLLIVKNGNQYHLDSATANIENKQTYTSVSLISQSVRLSYYGSVKINALEDVLKEYVNRYFYDRAKELPVADSIDNFNIKLEILNSELLTNIFWPDLHDIQPSYVEGSYSAANHTLDLHADFPSIGYKNQQIDSLKINLHAADTNALNYSIRFQRFSAPPFAMDRTTMDGSVTNNILSFSVKSGSTGNQDRFVIAGNISKYKNEYTLHIDPHNFIINFADFSLPLDNEFIFGKQNIRFVNIDMASDNQRIRISNTGDSLQTNDYMVDFSEFAVSNLTGLFETGRDILTGTIDGKLLLSRKTNGSTIYSDLSLNNVMLFNDTVFNTIKLEASTTREGMLIIDSKFAGRKNNLSISGDIGLKDKSNPLNLKADIQQIDLKIMAPFIRKQFSEFNGEMGGNLKITGNIENPKITGELNFENTTVVPAFLNTRIHIADEKLKLKNRDLIFNHFTIQDDLKNKAELNGRMNFDSLTAPEFNLRFSSKGFRFLNSTSNENTLYYGRMIANVDATITGTLMKPAINLVASIQKPSVFHLVVPTLNAPTIEKEGIVKFVDRNKSTGQQIMERNLENNSASVTNSNNPLLNLTAYVEIDEGTKIYILVDPASNEELYVNGKGNMSLSMKGNSTPNLTGRYEIEEGTYSLTLYDVIRRTFTIKSGSYLQWNGNMMNPQTDITTIYQVNTSPFPLIADETTLLNASDNSLYSEIIPFNVELHLSGHLLQPDLKFNLNVPQGHSNALVDAKLTRLNNDETELNKQVFSLLLFNNFMQGTTSANKPVAYELNSTARSSVSRILTQQLNSFAERHIKGFNVDIAVNSYYQSMGKQSAGKTNVKLNFSKELFGKRLNVQVGGDINVEGTEQKTPFDFNSIAGDLAIEYKLDEAGTFRLRGFSKSEYEDVIDGEVIATGISFIFNKDFYRLNDLLKKDTTNIKP